MSEWESFYVIVGSSGGALIGLQFVVMTLVADSPQRASADTLNAFATPTIVHLAGALVVSAVMSAPWQSMFALSIALVTCGAAGIGYSAIVVRRARRQSDYRPVWQDWLWYALLPCCGYGTLATAAVFLRRNSHSASFAIAAAALALLLIGIHNAWDTVTHLVTRISEGEATGDH